MAPQRGTKRAAQTQAESPVDKFLKAQGTSRAMYKAVVEALEHPLLVVPEGCRKMLITMIPKSLCVPSDERHELQTQSVQMIADAIREVQAKMHEAVEAEQAQVVKAESAKSELEEQLQQAKDMLMQKQEKLKASESVLADASQSVLSAKATLTSKQEEKTNFDANCKQVVLSKDAFEGVIVNDVKKLVEGTWEEGNAKNHFDALSALFGKFTVEESLLAVLPGSLMRKPAERGSFDLMAVAQLDKNIQDKLRELTSALEQQAPQLQERDAAVVSAQKDYDEASEEEKKAASAVSADQQDEKTAVATENAAKVALGSGEVEIEKFAEARDQKKNELDAFEYNSGCFDQLKDRVASKNMQGAAEEAAEGQPAVAGA